MDQRFEDLLQSQKISLSELARNSQITPGYLSKVLNRKTQRVSLSILSRLSKQLELSTEDLFKMIMDKDYRPESLFNHQSPIILDQKNCEELVQNALDALELGDHEAFQIWSERAKLCPSPLLEHYLNWFEGLQLAYDNLYNQALEKFSKALRFKPQTALEKRFKAKVLFGQGSLYLGKGDHKKALIMFRKSLLAWGEGVHRGIIYLNMGTLNRRIAAFPTAELCYRSALSTPFHFIQLLSYAGLGQIYMDLKRYSEARTVLLQGYCLAKKSSDDRGKGELFCNLGKYYMKIGRSPLAIRILRQGLRYSTSPASRRTKQFLLTELIDAYSASQHWEVEPLIQTLLEAEISEGDVVLVGSSLLMVAKEKVKSKHILEAITLLQQSYRVLAGIFPSEELIICCDLLADCYQYIKDPYQSEFYLKESKRLKKLIT